MNIFIFIYYLLDITLPRGWLAKIPRKQTRRKERSKNGSGQKAEPSAPTQEIDARMGETVEPGNRPSDMEKNPGYIIIIIIKE